MKPILITATFYLIVLLLVLWLCQTKVEFSPFSIKIEKWRSGLGVLLIGIGVLLIQSQGFQDGKNSFIEEVKELVKEKRRPSDRV